MSFWPYWPVWPILLLACGITYYFNWRIAVVFAAHILAMQVIKFLNLPQEQLLFFACYSAFAFISAMWFDKVGGFVLATISFIYLASILGFVGYLPRVILAEFLLVAGMIIGAVNGPSEGIRALGFTLHSDQPLRGIDMRKIRHKGDLAHSKQGSENRTP